MKTARWANETKNYKCELLLLEQAINVKTEVTGHLLRLYVSVLYKNGEYRAAAMISSHELCLKDDDTEYTTRIRESLDKKISSNFLSIISRLYT